MKWKDAHDYIEYQKPQKPQNHKNFYKVRWYPGLSYAYNRTGLDEESLPLQQPVPPKVFVNRVPSMRNW